ncbi:MAG: hypothetical protein VYA34_14780, partial [Myxococcota bacterium]|nr:hypothetical protein [Myxococcota bacterium]
KKLTLADGTQLPYLGVNTSTSPILDFVHASTFLLNSSEVISLSELLLNVVKEKPILLAKSVDVIRDLFDRLDVSPFNEIELNASHQLMDELLVILKEIALVPGLLEDLVSALGSEKGRKLGDYFGRYMKYRDKVDVSMGEGADINGPPVTSSPSGSNTTFSYAHLVDRSQNDNFDNRSLFHRFTHLIADTSGARFCNREGAKLVVQLGGLDLEYPLGRPEGFKKCELFDIPDMAEFYIQVLLGTGELKFKDDLLETFADLGGVASDSILESFSGIEGFTKRPTPMAVNRAMFGERNDFLNGIFDDPRTIDGTSLRERHPATIFAWEEPGFVDSMLPVLGVLAKYEKESILGRVFKVLASHWYSSESDMNQRIMSEGGEALKATGLVQYEEVLGSWLEEVKPLAVVTDLVNYLANVQVGDKKGNEVLGAFLRRASAPGYSGARLRPERSGVLLGDGSEAIFETVTPVDLFLDGWRRYEGYRLESDTSLINRLSKVVLYRLLAAKKSGEEIVGFQSEYGAALFERGLEVLIQELRQEQGNGTLDSYVDDWVDEARSLIEKPYFGASVDLMAQIGNSAEASAAFRDFVLYLLNAENSNASFDTLLVTLTDGVQLLRDETAVRATLLAFGELLDSPSSAVDKTIDFMLESKGYDEKDAVVALIRKLLTASVDDTQVPLDIFWDSIAGVCRIDPSKTAPRDRADFKEILTDVSAFIYDEDRGLERLFQIVQNRAK